MPPRIPTRPSASRRTQRSTPKAKPARGSAPATTAAGAPSTWRTPLPELDALELDLLTVLALAEAHEELTRTRWKEQATRHGVHSPSGRQLTAAELTAIADRLAQRQLVETSDGARGTASYGLTPDVAMRVLAHAAHCGRLSRLRGVVRGREPSLRHLYAAMWRTPGRLATDLRVALVEGDAATAAKITSDARDRAGRELDGWLFETLGGQPERAWVLGLPADVQPRYLARLVQAGVHSLVPIPDDLLELARAVDDKAVRLSLGRLSVLRGEPFDADPASLPRWGLEGLRVIEAFVAGDWARAAASGDAACAAMTTRKRKALPDFEGVCHLLARVVRATSNPSELDALGTAIEHAPRSDALLPEVQPLLVGIHRALLGDRSYLYSACLRGAPFDRTWPVALVRLLHDLWLDPAAEMQAVRRDARREEIARVGVAIARAWGMRALASGYGIVAREMSAIAAALQGEAVGADRLAGAFRPVAAWETAIARLLAAAEAAAGEVKPAPAETALVWEVTVYPRSVAIGARRRSGPRAKKGTALSPSRLAEALKAGTLDPADARVAAALLSRDPSDVPVHRAYTDGRDGARPAGLAGLLALVGHPRVVDVHGAPVTVERGTVTLATRRDGDLTRVELKPAALAEREAVVMQPSPNEIVVYERGRRLDPFVEILGQGRGLAVPDGGRDRLADALVRVCVAAGVEVEGDLPIATQTVAADGRLVLRMHWDGQVLTVRVGVAPLGLSGPHLRPGAGAATIVGDVAGADQEAGSGRALGRCRRDLARERAACDALLDACPNLAGHAVGDLVFSVPTLGDALEVLLEIDAHAQAVARVEDGGIVIAWPQGKALAPPPTLDLRHLRLAVKAHADWLAVDAALAVDETTVLGFAALLAAREGTRFVALGHDRFVALSDALRRQLDALGNLGALDGDRLKVSSVALAHLDELAADVDDVTWEDAARERLEKLREAMTFTPRLPRALRATLRDYQRDGWVWMSRLARAGLGACLADDMGLGKTVQALALLCERASVGPALVVCPTSVLANWEQEAQRFAPTLRVAALATASDRAALLSGLGARDVVVCSYALLVAEADALSEVAFATAVFDEAHALKNDRTKRAAAAQRISAGFRLGLSGTPVENRVGELWSLFRVLVPGLLGRKEDFEARFGTPIASGDRERAAHLRALLRTFVLRRTKAQVESELPSRTEVTIRVTPSAEERAFYEAVRRNAKERVEALDPKKARFRILAEITRLRQAAVDPRLLDKELGPPGAKIEALARKIVDLRDEGHRALVFTQFLEGMAAVRRRLSADGIEILELDGSTPAAERARRIEAFQAGEADVFLLSLRAGGVGINLTAADYVFHLDPWWNPAVEDQATDRAHRIGQTRPVTVYRLVTEGTIEERILALHETKRQLAADLIGGLEPTGDLDLDQLVALLQA